MEISITKKGAELGYQIFDMIRQILVIAKIKGIKDIRDIQINNLLKNYRFFDEENKEYSPQQNKENIKKLIHMYIGVNLEKNFNTTDLVYILGEVNSTIEKLKKLF